MTQLRAIVARDLRNGVDHALALVHHQTLTLDVSLRVHRVSLDVRASEHHAALRDGARHALAARALAVQQ